MSITFSPDFIDWLEICPSQLLWKSLIPYPDEISYKIPNSKDISIKSKSNKYAGDWVFTFGKKITISEEGILWESKMVENHVIIEWDDNISKLQIWAWDKSQLILNLDWERKTNEYEEVADISSFRLESDINQKKSEININHDWKDWVLINPNNTPLGLLEYNLEESIRIAKELIWQIIFNNTQISEDIQASILEFKIAALSAYEQYESSKKKNPK